MNRRDAAIRDAHDHVLRMRYAAAQASHTAAMATAWLLVAGAAAMMLILVLLAVVITLWTALK